ncbi:DUF3833 domain-containing protein [Pseudofrancisella aestuarii]|uniref:DUF3833 domain-containing protein n=1 Tax=Pseudofrancisella aestuarii TaxID=2670347 RepID=A0ABV9T9D2_9GAMM|nr:DUF3833 domain-containing protein [Pseudofrancisella aestuarii]
MKKLMTKLGVIIMAISLFGCSTNIQSYKDMGPKLDLKEYLQGHIAGTGIIQDWKGKVVKQFEFSGDASWQDNEGTFDEHMTYYDGSKDHRIWKITKIDDNHYEATTHDVIGKANITLEGNAMNWQYQMKVPVNGKEITINFDDWMYLMNNGVLINKNTFRKFGIKVGSLTLFMKKENNPNAKA